MTDYISVEYRTHILRKLLVTKAVSMKEGKLYNYDIQRLY